MTPRITVTAVTPRLLPRVLFLPVKASEPFWANRKRSPGRNSAASTANTSLSKGAPGAQTNHRPLTWLLAQRGLLAQRVVERQIGEIPLPQRLLCRIRYFTDGVILGSQGFVESHFGRLNQKLGYRRHRVATCATALGSVGLWLFRDPRLRAVDWLLPAPFSIQMSPRLFRHVSVKRDRLK